MQELMFAFPKYHELARRLGREIGAFTVERFSNQELHLTLQCDVKGKTCEVLGSIAPPESQLVSFLMLCRLLKKEGAKKVTAVIPYLAYSRHDKSEERKSQNALFIGEQLLCSGVDEVITCDIHSDLSYPLPLTSYSPAPLFASKLKAIGWQDAAIIAPDLGALHRRDALNAALGGHNQLGSFAKVRTNGVFEYKFDGRAADRCVIIDDILDTGSTLIACCEQLRRQGVKAITAMVTHGVFTGDRWKSLDVDHLFYTDTLPQSGAISIAPLFKDENNAFPSFS